MKTESELVLEEIEKLFKPILIKGRGINFGPPNADIAMTIKDLQQCDMLEIENYKGFQIRVIIKKL